MNNTNQKYFPEFKEIKFESEEDFRKWLKEKTDMKICFKDNGQDCLFWYIDKGGEVLHSELQPFVWNGMIVDLGKLKIGKEIGVIDSKNKQTIFYDFEVEAIEINKNRI